MNEERKPSPFRENFLNLGSISQYRNALYGVAILWIVMFHGVALENLEIGENFFFFDQTFRMGNVAVDMFMLLSGICLYFSYSKGPKLGDFYLKRVVRVYIPYLLMTLPYIIYCFVDGQIDLPLMIKAIFTVNFWTGESTPIDFWYISLLLVLYLLYPLFFLILFRPATGKLSQGAGELIRMLIMVAVSFALSMVIFFCMSSVYVVLARALSRITVFLFGCYLGKAVKEKRRFHWIFLVLSLLILIGAYPLYVGENSILRGIWGRYYGSLTGVAVVLLLSQLFILLSYIKLDKVFGFFGSFSLEIYVMTILGRKIFYNTPLYQEGEHVLRWYLIFMAVSILAAYAVFWIEKPIAKLILGSKKKT